VLSVWNTEIDGVEGQDGVSKVSENEQSAKNVDQKIPSSEWEKISTGKVTNPEIQTILCRRRELFF
jgi:hypothetical protein